MTSTKYDDNYIVYLKSGSTIIGGAISAPNISEARSIQGNLTNKIPN
jgi:hypothetical protein